MVNAVNSSPSAAAAALAAKAAAAPSAAAPRPAAEAPKAAVVSVSTAGAERAGSAAARARAEAPASKTFAQADTNQDGTVSDQERLTDVAQREAQRALLQGSSNLDEALQAYQAIASLADVQR